MCTGFFDEIYAVPIAINMFANRNLDLRLSAEALSGELLFICGGADYLASPRRYARKKHWTSTRISSLKIQILI